MLIDFARAGIGIHQRHVTAALLECTLLFLALFDGLFFRRLLLLEAAVRGLDLAHREAVLAHLGRSLVLVLRGNRLPIVRDALLVDPLEYLGSPDCVGQAEPEGQADQQDPSFTTHAHGLRTDGDRGRPIATRVPFPLVRASTRRHRRAWRCSRPAIREYS